MGTARCRRGTLGITVLLVRVLSLHLIFMRERAFRRANLKCERCSLRAFTTSLLTFGDGFALLVTADNHTPNSGGHRRVPRIQRQPRQRPAPDWAERGLQVVPVREQVAGGVRREEERQRQGGAEVSLVSRSSVLALCAEQRGSQRVEETNGS